MSASECLLPRVNATFECPFNVPGERPKMAGCRPMQCRRNHRPRSAYATSTTS
jgi:hypothetical protein